MNSDGSCISFTHSINCLIHNNALIVGIGDVLAVLVSPVCGDALFRNANAFRFVANLHLERLSGMNDRCMERLVQVRPGMAM